VVRLKLVWGVADLAAMASVLERGPSLLDPFRRPEIVAIPEPALREQEALVGVAR